MSILNGGPLYAKGLRMSGLRRVMRETVSARNDADCLRYRLTDMKDGGVTCCTAMDVVEYVEKNKDSMGFGSMSIPEGSVEAFRAAALSGKYDALVEDYWNRYAYNRAHPVPMSDPDHYRSVTGGYAAEGVAEALTKRK